MNETLYQLNHCPDVATLRGRMSSLFSGFGSISKLDIIDTVQAGRRQALCFLRLESTEQEKRLTRDLGVGRFGGDLVIVVDLNLKQAANDGKPSSVAA
jgi:hypothetical protein